MSFDRDQARLAAILVLTAGLAFAASPFFTSGFNGFTPDQFPIPQENAPIQPAGWAFSIWGLIYLWMLVHAFTGLVKRDDDPAWAPMRWPLFISLALGASWISVAQQSPVLATFQIWIMLLAALIALSRSPVEDRWTAQAPLAIYAGWLTAASFVALGLSMAGNGIILDATGWAVAGLVGLTAFATAFQQFLGRAPEYSTTVIWALSGVIAANLGDRPVIAALAGVAAAILAVQAFRIARRA